MKTEHEFQSCATKLKALSQATRLRIVKELFNSRCNVSQLCERVGDSMVNVSHHLGVLKNAEIVGSVAEGREVYYWLTSPITVDGQCVELGCCRLDLDPTRE